MTSPMTALVDADKIIDARLHALDAAVELHARLHAARAKAGWGGPDVTAELVRETAELFEEYVVRPLA